jgi:hypothetical protein
VSNLSYLSAFVRVQSCPSKIVGCLCANASFEKVSILLLDLNGHGLESVFLDFESGPSFHDLLLERNLMDAWKDSIDYHQIASLPMQDSLR